jgi:hypothetical protein
MDNTPDTTNWVLLSAVALIGGGINALKAYRSKSSFGDWVVWILEFLTTIFVTWLSYLMLSDFWPLIYDLIRLFAPSLPKEMRLPVAGLVALSGGIAHMGLRGTIKLILRIPDRSKE